MPDVQPPNRLPQLESPSLRSPLNSKHHTSRFDCPNKEPPRNRHHNDSGRDEAKVTNFAKKYGIKKAYSRNGCYDAVVNDPDIDAVYIPLLHVYHYEWSLKALNTGKHVLVEKPRVNTPEEAAQLHDVAQEKGLGILEAMHIRFHPAIQRATQIVDSGELGAVMHVAFCSNGS
ncbi:hypothetical protein BJ165DRAFT_1527102 [Panaeolus papilionaceus]|nr:hypothetical protein BJ165DRAFT_1527102 [Panaeolus papilionaceus]